MCFYGVLWNIWCAANIVIDVKPWNRLEGARAQGIWTHVIVNASFEEVSLSTSQFTPSLFSVSQEGGP